MTSGTNAPTQTSARETRETRETREARETGDTREQREQTGGLARLGRSIALIGLIVLSLLTGAAALSLLRGWSSIAAIGLAVAVWRPRWALALLLALLPIFGNKPGTRQLYALVLLGSCLNIGVALRGLVSWPRPQRPAASHNPLFVLLLLYGVASTLTLSTLPLTQIWLDSLNAVGGTSNPVAHLALWLKATETDAAYSIVSVILTWYAIALAFFIRREIACDTAPTTSTSTAADAATGADAAAAAAAATGADGAAATAAATGADGAAAAAAGADGAAAAGAGAGVGAGAGAGVGVGVGVGAGAARLVAERTSLAARSVPFVANSANSALLFARSIVIGLIATLVVGILDFYQLADLRPLRQLDPVVNFFGQQRLQATFGHSGWFAEYVVMSLAYIAIVLAGSRRVRWGICWIVGLLLLAELGLILTYQRGGWISHVCPLLTIWLAVFYAADVERGGRRFREMLRRSLPKLALAVPLTVGVALVIFLGVVQLGWFGSGWRFNAGSYVERATGLFDTSNRSMYISTGLKLGRLHPVLGAGSESFAFNYLSEYLRPGGAFYGTGDPLPVLYGSAHNVYLQTLTGKGGVGLALLLALLACVVGGGGRILLRRSDLPKPTVLLLLATIGSVLGFACYGVVQEVFYIQSIQYLMFATFALAGAVAEPWLHITARSVRWLWIALAGMFVLHLAFEYGYPGRTRDRWFWQEAVREGWVLGITEIDAHGSRFRWSGARAFLDLPCSARTISVPVRSLADVPQQVEIRVNGKMIDRVALADHGWRELRYSLPRSPWFVRSHCVELLVDPLWHPPGDARRLGVMVGAYSWQ